MASTITIHTQPCTLAYLGTEGLGPKLKVSPTRLLLASAVGILSNVDGTGYWAVGRVVDVDESVRTHNLLTSVSLWQSPSAMHIYTHTSLWKTYNTSFRTYPHPLPPSYTFKVEIDIKHNRQQQQTKSLPPH